MDDYLEKLQMQVLDFAYDKRIKWETERQLYAVHFEITPKCNFHCVHCYLRDHHDSAELPFERVIEILDVLHEKGVLFITFTGGEIFARRDFLDIYLYAKTKGFIIELFTNGTLIGADAIKVFSKYPPLLVDVSIYGACEETYRRVTGVCGVFSKVIENCKKLVAANIRVALKSPMLTLTLVELQQMKDLSLVIGVPFRASFEIIPTIDRDRQPQQYQVSVDDMLACEFADSKRNSHARTDEAIEGLKPVDLLSDKPLYRCKIGCASCIIDYSGRMCPCMKSRYFGEEITRFNCDSLWDSFKIFQEATASASYKCLTCDAYEYCDICPAEMLFLYGNAEHIDDRYCECAKKRKTFYRNMA